MNDNWREAPVRDDAPARGCANALVLSAALWGVMIVTLVIFAMWLRRG